MEADKQILFASKYAYMYYQYVSEAFQDYSLQFTQNGKQAISYLKKYTPSVVILGENLKELNTLKLCKAIRKSARLSSTKIMLLVPDHTNVLELDPETTETVDIILRHTQKPSAFVTHIGKLLKASEDLTFTEYGAIQSGVIQSSAIQNSAIQSGVIQTSASKTSNTYETHHTALNQPKNTEQAKDTIDTGESMASALISPEHQAMPQYKRTQQFVADNNDDLIVVHEQLPPVAITPNTTPITPNTAPITPNTTPLTANAAKLPIAPPGHYQSLAKQSQAPKVKSVQNYESVRDYRQSTPIAPISSVSSVPPEAHPLSNLQTNNLHLNSTEDYSVFSTKQPLHTAPAIDRPINPVINPATQPTNHTIQAEHAAQTNDFLSATQNLATSNPVANRLQTDHTLEQQRLTLSNEVSETNPVNVNSFNATNSYGQHSSGAATAKTIAIIEDNASIAFLEKSILERQGYNTIQISDAPQARDFVDTHFDMADLVLLDLNLPGGSGFEILRRIRSFSRKPVIIVSGLKQSENIKRGLSLGAQDYLTKPMNPQELILRVSQHIKNFG